MPIPSLDDALGAALLDRLPLGVSAYRQESPGDPRSFRLIYGNAASDAISGLDIETEQGRLLVDVAPEIAATGLLDTYADVLREGTARDLGLVEYGDDRIARATYAVRAVPLSADTLAVVFEDVTDREEVRALRETEDQLREEESRSRTLLDAIDDAVFVYPLRPEGPGPFVAFNEATIARYGYAADELHTMTVTDIVDGDRFELGPAIDELRRQRKGQFESVHRTRDGDRLYMSTSARIVEYGGELCVVALSRDDSARRQFRREIARANRQLEDAVAERTAQLEAFSEDLKILHGITTAEHASPEARFDAYLQAGCEMFDLPIGILASTPTDPASGERLYRVEATVSPVPEIAPGVTVPLREAFCDAVVEAGHTITYGDAAEEAPDHPACAGRGLRAYIGTPVTVDGEPVGTLNFVSPEPRPDGFSDVERDLVEVMAQAVGRRLESDRAEASEAEARERYRGVVETVDAGVMVVGRDGDLVLANPVARAALGITDDGGLASRWPVVAHDGTPVAPERLPEHSVFADGCAVRDLLQGIVSPSGETRWYRVHASPVGHDSDGVPTAVVVSFQDVTSLRETALAARKAEEMLRAVLSASPDGVMAFRAVRDEARAVVDFEWLVVNPRASDIVGKRAEDLVGRRLLEVFPGNRDAGLFDAYATVADEHGRFDTTVDYPHDGFTTTFEITALPVPSIDGITVRFVEVLPGHAVAIDP